MEEHTQKFDSDDKQFEQQQQPWKSLFDGKLTDTMCHILTHRLKNTDERLQTFYDIKVLFFVEAPTVKHSILAAVAD
ncbi:unnamed protein product [Adineta steineri]|uniref:Uncharacterized protein n=1 Tax=Adineta steineri TaxID=433720 RepID=A0A814R838_9BILA|nr:unnamed protein product [Adineta steineri]CAF1310852.1 unnamed protein product [Adineta steineri]